MKKLLFIFLLLFMPACAPWIIAGGPYESLPHNFCIDIPQGWMKLNTDRYLLISEDGPFLQYVLIQDRDIDRSFRHTKKKINRGMLPQEAAEVVLDEIISDQSVLNLEIIENVPTRIDQHDGFRVVFTYKNKDGLTLKTIYYGFLAGERFYNIRYTAVKRHYFEKDIETFKKVMDSFKLIKAPAQDPSISQPIPATTSIYLDQIILTCKHTCHKIILSSEF
jgi:hypothetical protein